MSQKKNDFFTKGPESEKQRKFFSSTYAGTGSIFSLLVFHLPVYLDFPLCSM